MSTRSLLLLTSLVLGGIAAAGCHLSTRSPALAEAARAPELALPDAAGRVVRLAELTVGGAAVLVFYRGHW